MEAAKVESLPDPATQIALAIDQLETLQDQITNLRPAIACLVETLSPPLISTISTTQLYLDFAKAATQASQGVRKLRADWEDQKSQDAFSMAQESLQQDDDLEWEFVLKRRVHTASIMNDIASAAP